MSFKIREAHWNVLLEFMLDHPELARGRLNTAQARKDYNSMWTDLGEKLNSLGLGKKTTDKWQKSWSDYKMNLKKKAAEINKSSQLTGGGPGTTKFLTDFELKVLSLLGDTFYKGVGVQEIGVSTTTTEEKRGMKEKLNQNDTEGTENVSLPFQQKIKLLPPTSQTSMLKLKAAWATNPKSEENDSKFRFIEDEPASLSFLPLKPSTSQQSRQEVQTTAEQQICSGLVEPNKKIPFRKRPQPTGSFEERALNNNNDHDYLANMPGPSIPKKNLVRQPRTKTKLKDYM